MGADLFSVLLAMLLGMSAAAAAGVLLLKYGTHLPLSSVMGGGLYLLLLALALRWATGQRTDSSSQKWFWALLLITTLVKTAVVLVCRDYLQTGDRATFIRFVDALVTRGLGAENLASLTSFFDYRAWLSRAFPVAFAIRWLFGASHVLFYQLSNVLFSALSLYLFHRLAACLLKPAGVRAACVIYALFPLRLFYALEYTHQFQVEFYVLAGTLVLVQLVSSGGQGWKQWVRAALLGLLLFLLHLQIGWDVLVFAMVLLAFMVRFTVPSAKGGRGVLVGILIVTCSVYFVASAPFDRWAAQHAFPTSGVPGFMARGWSMDALGEYDNLPEQLESAAPSAEKAQTMYAYVLSQMYYFPRDMVVKLLPAKMAKYFLAGYATDMDQTFWQSGMPVWGDLFMGFRLFYAPVFLLLAVTGCAALVRRRAVALNWFLMVFLPILACGVFVLFGETSPKYSFYIHAHISLIAANAFSLRSRSDDWACGLRQTLVRMLGLAAGMLCLYFLIVRVAASVVHSTASPWVFKNMREARAESSRPVFERTLLLDRDAAAGKVEVRDALTWPGASGVSSKTVLYLWPLGDDAAMTNAQCGVFVNGQGTFETALHELHGVKRVEWVSGGGAAEQTVEMRLSGPAGQGAPGSAGVRWGYIHSIPAAKQK